MLQFLTLLCIAQGTDRLKQETEKIKSTLSKQYHKLNIFTTECRKLEDFGRGVIAILPDLSSAALERRLFNLQKDFIKQLGLIEDMMTGVDELDDVSFPDDIKVKIASIKSVLVKLQFFRQVAINTDLPSFAIGDPLEIEYNNFKKALNTLHVPAEAAVEDLSVSENVNKLGETLSHLFTSINALTSALENFSSSLANGHRAYFRSANILHNKYNNLVTVGSFYDDFVSQPILE
jgi:hypothetical protein